MFSVLARYRFNAPVHDVYCGLRGFTKDLQQRLHQRSTGMEFAMEMIIKSSRYGVKIAEGPTTLHPDRRQSHATHLKTFRDGWCALRFFLMYCPRWMRPACMRTLASSPKSQLQPLPHHIHG
jgi:hypothetical protein